MKRHWNAAIWIGFLVVLLGLFSFPFFIRFPSTRDFPWANLLIFAVGGFFLAVGLSRAFRQSNLYRGKVSGVILAFLSLLVVGFFGFVTFYVARQLPAAKSAPQVGQKAPDFSLPDENGKAVSLGDLLAGSNGAVLIFYRGFW